MYKLLFFSLSFLLLHSFSLSSASFEVEITKKDFERSSSPGKYFPDLNMSFEAKDCENILDPKSCSFSPRLLITYEPCRVHTGRNHNPVIGSSTVRIICSDANTDISYSDVSRDRTFSLIFSDCTVRNFAMRDVGISVMVYLRLRISEDASGSLIVNKLGARIVGARSFIPNYSNLLYIPGKRISPKKR